MPVPTTINRFRDEAGIVLATASDTTRTLSDDTGYRLLNEFQHDFPLGARPFAEIARHLGLSEAEVLKRLGDFQRSGLVSRVGVVFRPHRVGASTLAAMAVPADRLESVSQLVNRFDEVNHNYQRAHHWNLWFVVTAGSNQRIHEILHEIEQASGLKVLFLPMLEDYHIDLGFDLLEGATVTTKRAIAGPETFHKHGAKTRQMSEQERDCLVAAVQEGFPLVSRPFAAIARTCATSEVAVIAGIEELRRSGAIKRIGVVVRHRELGYRANAMAVWDAPDHRVTHLGRCIGEFPFVTLCYRRSRHLPHWTYNLYCMVHGSDHEAVRDRIAEIIDHCNLGDLPHALLFSQRRFKQRGARYRSQDLET